MTTKENKIKITLKNIIFLVFGFFIILYSIMFYNMYFKTNESYAKEVDTIPEKQIKISEAKEINMNEIINKNVSNEQSEKIERREEVLEYLTQYKINKDIPKGISYVVQEGREGKQEITTKYTYDINEQLISEEQIKVTIVKSSADKIVEIGGANYTSNYKVKKGDIIYVTSDILALWSEPKEESRKITTLKQQEEMKVVDIIQNWYKVIYNNMNGWVKSECTTYIDLNKEKEQYNNKMSEKSKNQILSELGFNMELNKPSGLTLNQFKKILSDEKDKNKIFINNAEYFYYIEKQYNINGVFVAAVGIHESDWGTSEIALQKNNLFGYGAYDSSPYNSAYTYNSYSQSIDLIARVFVKYYLNPKGTNIYGGEKAIGTYYNGVTLTSVNNKYATDKNWANAVYSHMKYLYNKL